METETTIAYYVHFFRNGLETCVIKEDHKVYAYSLQARYEQKVREVQEVFGITDDLKIIVTEDFIT